MKKKYLYIEADSNDADYIGKLTPITDEELEKFRPIFENANKQENRSHGRYDHGVPTERDYWDKSCNPGGLWEGISKELEEEFLLNFIPSCEWSDSGYCYIIAKIKVLTLEEDVLDYNTYIIS